MILLALVAQAAANQALEPQPGCVALSVGNSNYRPIRPLPNTLNDAQRIAERLRQDGKCKVTEIADLRTEDTKAKLDLFLRQIRPGQTVYFYFSGHGVQSDDENLLVNVNATVAQVATQSIRFRDFLRDIRARNPKVIVAILDACRERLEIPETATQTKGIFVGMALQQAEANTVLIYATARGQLASAVSPRGDLSMFTAVFLDHFRAGADLYTAFMDTKQQVMRDSRGAQEPWLDFQATDRVCLGGVCGPNVRQVAVEELKPKVKCADARPFPYVEGKVWGYLSCEGKVKVRAQYDSAWPFSEGSVPLAAVRVNGKYGYIDMTGRMRIQPQFDEAYEFDKGGMAAVKKGPEAYFIGMSGDRKSPVYQAARSFAGGLAPVAQLVDGQVRWGYIGTRIEDRETNERTFVIKAKFEDAQPFGSNGIAAVQLNGLWGFIDKKGETVIEPRFASAPVARAMEIMVFYNGLCPAYDGKQWGFIDEKGAWAIPAAFSRVKRFRDGLAAVQIRVGEKALKWGYLNGRGEFQIPPSYDNAYDFHGEVAIVRQDGAGGPFHRLVAINRSGVFLLPPE